MSVLTAYDYAGDEVALVHADNAELRTQLILAEVQLLREAKAWQDAYDVLTAALRAQPQSVDLRYDRAMIADKLGRFEDLEADLRLLLTIKPDHAHALNALGYSLAERGVRLAEAEQLIRKAITQAPDDGYIVDSLGWVQFKQGRAEEALQTLQRAYRLKQDPEIAAHLGEVLWSLGQRAEARKIWAEGMKKNPNQDDIKRVREKFSEGFSGAAP
jgi:tetratricopeptide (TPR) repeat protein